jgi:hypothetical protein
MVESPLQAAKPAWAAPVFDAVDELDSQNI